MLRQVRRSSPRTKLKINSSAMSRRTNRSASLKSCLCPRGARLENACANCKRRYGSNSSHTVRQYCAVDSMTASSTLCSRNQIDNRCRVARHGGESSSLRLLLRCARIDHDHHQHSLVYVNSRYLVGHSCLQTRKRQNARTETLSTVTCYPSSRRNRAHTDWFKTHVPDQTREQPHFI